MAAKQCVPARGSGIIGPAWSRGREGQRDRVGGWRGYSYWRKAESWKDWGSVGSARENSFHYGKIGSMSIYAQMVEERDKTTCSYENKDQRARQQEEGNPVNCIRKLQVLRLSCPRMRHGVAMMKMWFRCLYPNQIKCMSEPRRQMGWF